MRTYTQCQTQEIKGVLSLVQIRSQRHSSCTGRRKTSRKWLLESEHGGKCEWASDAMCCWVTQTQRAGTTTPEHRDRAVRSPEARPAGDHTSPFITSMNWLWREREEVVWSPSPPCLRSKYYHIWRQRSAPTLRRICCCKLNTSSMFLCRFI